MNAITFIKAARLHTLPLSVSGIITGSAIALCEKPEAFHWDIFLLVLLTTVLFQTLSNSANDYGDGVEGTDSEHRIDPTHALQNGAITRQQMKRVVSITATLSILSAIVLIVAALGGENLLYTLTFSVLGLPCVATAIKCTIGSSTYDYRELGGVFVFVFFDLVSVVGSQFLYTQQVDKAVWLPAIAIGLSSVAVLNLNSIRDYENDRRPGKHILVVRMGTSSAKYYHYYLVVMAMVAMLDYSVWCLQTRWQLLYFIVYLPLAVHLLLIKHNTELQLLDKELKIVAMSIFLLSVLFFIGIYTNIRRLATND